jgi:lysozyme
MKSWIHKEGSAGQEVARVQKILSINQDGKFGPQTKAALEQFQSNNGLVVDGVLGPKTRQEMEIEIYGGIDVSKWNKINHWDLLKNSGQAEFCWVKATEGNTYVCNQFQKNLQDVKAAGIRSGAYHFARPDLHDDPHLEVKNFLKHCPIEKGQLKPVLDFEEAGTHSPKSIRSWVLTFLKEFEDQSGISPIVYTGGNMVKYHLNGDTTGIDTYPLWHALYSKKALEQGIPGPRLGGWKEWRVWQWTGSGALPGVEGEIDRNWLVGGKKGLKEITIL